MTPVNSKVQKAAKAVGKDITGMVEYNSAKSNQFNSLKEKRKQYTYAAFIERGPMTFKEFEKVSNYPEWVAKDTIIELEKMGLLTSTILLDRKNAKQFRAADDRHIPEGWPPRGELLTMESPYRDYVHNPKERVLTGEEAVAAEDNALTRALKNPDYHLEDVSSYEQFLKDTSKFYGLEELDDIITDLHALCKRRIEQKYVPCPLCKGRIQRDGSKATCVACGAEINAGSFEQSMKALSILAKAGVKVV